MLLCWFFSVRVCKYENQSLAPSGVYHKRMAEPRKAGKGRFCPPHYYWHPQILLPSTMYVIGKNWGPFCQKKVHTIFLSNLSPDFQPKTLSIYLFFWLIDTLELINLTIAYFSSTFKNHTTLSIFYSKKQIKTSTNM